jgi:hypothetical protein
MKTYLFKVVKIEKSIIAQNKYRCISKINPNGATVPGTVAPDIFRTTKANQYLIDLKTDNIEMIRFVANTLIQAETLLFPNNRFLYVIVYECELGKAITNETNMTLLLDLTINKPESNGSTDTSDAYSSNSIQPTAFYTWRHWRDYRHTARGSGRYKPTFVKDPPRYFTQNCAMINDFSAVKLPSNDDFIGLSVVFERELGAAFNPVYMGAASKQNYYLDASGNIIFHRRGDVFHGAFDNYQKAFSAIWPLLSARRFDEEGILIECEKIFKNGKPNRITEFRAQRRAAYTKAGNSEKFKARFVVMLSDYIQEFCKFINDVQRWGHNLNFDVVAFKKTKVLYLKAERILRLISGYFPQELPLSGPLNAFSETTQISGAESLVLGNRFQESAECWDRLVLLVDWMRRNYVDYTLSPKIPDYTLEVGHELVRGPRLSDTIVKEGVYGTHDSDSMSVDARNRLAGTYGDRGHFYFASVVVTVTPASAFNAMLTTYTYTINNYQMVPGYAPVPELQFKRPYSQANQWIEQTSEIAADIEQVYLSFQFNALNFAELLAHLLTIIDSKPRADVTRKSGVLPGEILRTEQHELNKKRTYPRAIKPKIIDNRTDGTLQDLEVPSVPFPDFKPLSIDARAIILRCAKDVTEQDEDEQAEEDKEREADRSQEDRDAFDQQQDEIERRKIKAQEKPRFKWRNEIDDLTPEQRKAERISLYNEIADNLNNVLDVVDAVDTTVSGFAILACPPSTPLVVGQKVAFKTGTSGMKKAVRKLAEKTALDWPELPEFDDATEETEIESPEFPSAPQGEVPRPRVRHKYRPPRKDDSPDFTGDEPDPREWEECFENLTQYWFTSGGLRLRSKIIPDIANEVDLQVVESYEAGGSRELAQTGLRYFDDILESGPCEEIAEDDPQSRYRCHRAAPRVPRS